MGEETIPARPDPVDRVRRIRSLVVGDVERYTLLGFPDGTIYAALMKTYTQPMLIAASLAGALTISGLAGEVAATDAAAAPNTLTKAEQNAGWRLLFDGKTTAGWRGYKKKEMPAGWKVIGGILTRVSGGEGGKGAGGGDDIITAEQFENFDLKLEWRLVEGGNSGILFRVSEDAVTSWHTAPEMQVLDNSKHPTRKKEQLAGACYDLYAPSKDVTVAASGWNKVRIRAEGNHITHWLNGVKIVEYEIGSDDWKKRIASSKFKSMPKFAKQKKGYICLQDHTKLIEFRSIKILQLR